MAIDLKSIQKNKSKPPRITFYGSIGVGKTKTAAQAPNPVFIQTDDGLGEDEIMKFPKIQSYQDLMDCISVLATEDHDYKTVVIDTIDGVEQFIWDEVCKEMGYKTIESPGWGIGHKGAIPYWRNIINALNYIRDTKNMMIILLCHEKQDQFNDPTGVSYDQFKVNLNKYAIPIVTGDMDVVAFIQMKAYTKTEDLGNKKTRNIAIKGPRTMHLSGSPAFVAKSRYPEMPDEIVLSWSEFAQYLPKQGV